MLVAPCAAPPLSLPPSCAPACCCCSSLRPRQTRLAGGCLLAPLASSAWLLLALLAAVGAGAAAALTPAPAAVLGSSLARHRSHFFAVVIVFTPRDHARCSTHHARCSTHWLLAPTVFWKCDRDYSEFEVRACLYIRHLVRSGLVYYLAPICAHLLQRHPCLESTVEA